MKIGYIASHLYIHTFEINEVTELLRQRPDTRIYSFYRPREGQFQHKRMEEIAGDITSWSYASILKGLLYLAVHHPIGLLRGAVSLAVRSLRNPVYWTKNFIVFYVALPMLADAARHGVTHLHANFGSSPATIAWLGKKILGLGMSVTFHAFDIYATALAQRDPLKRTKLRDAELIVAVHEDGKEYLRNLVPDADPEKFKVIRICVVFEPEQKPNHLPEPPLIIAAGNLVAKKGFDVLIKAVGYLKRRGVPVRLRILGEGPERPLLESLVRQDSIRDRVQLPGYFQHQKLAEHLAEAVALVVPSKVVSSGTRDGIPTVVVESWLSRTPVVASLVGGMSEVIVNESTGLVFPPDDAEALADCLQRLLESPELQHALADEGHRVACEMFSSQKNVLCLLREIREHRKMAEVS